MLVSAHSDDELVMMGGIIPTYAAERGMRVQVVYCYVPEQYRHEEALNGLWFSGMRTLPVFFVIENESRLRFAEKITREIRRFKPEVVITHDIMGEYGQYEYKNPQTTGHGLVSKNCREAVEAASDPKKFPKSAEEYGTWQVKKLYIHLYDKNQVVMDFDTPLSFFNGKTAFEIAQEAYAFHKSQRSYWLDVLKSNRYDCRKYGLYSTTVGEDVEKPVRLCGASTYAYAGAHRGAHPRAYAGAHPGTHGGAHVGACGPGHVGAYERPRFGHQSSRRPHG